MEDPRVLVYSQLIVFTPKLGVCLVIIPSTYK